MENKNEQFNIADVLGVTQYSNSIVVDIQAPVGTGVRTNCAAIIGVMSVRGKEEGGVKEELNLFAVGAMNEDLMVRYIVNMVCDAIVAYLGAARGVELACVLDKAIPAAVSKAVAKQCKDGEKLSDIFDGIESHMEEVKRLFAQSDENDAEESEDEEDGV